MTETLATVEGVMSIAFELARIREEHGAQSGMYLSEVRALRAEVERLAAQSAPTEIHADTPRHELLPRLRRLASDFQSHPLSRSISECEEAGELMTEAAAEIERLCRVRNCLAGSSRTRTARLRQLEQQRDYLLAEMCRIDNDTGNAGHYASEAVAAICAEEGARDVSKECTCSAADMPFGRCCKMKNNLPSRDWSAS